MTDDLAAALEKMAPATLLAAGVLRANAAEVRQALAASQNSDRGSLRVPAHA